MVELQRLHELGLDFPQNTDEAPSRQGVPSGLNLASVRRTPLHAASWLNSTSTGIVQPVDECVGL